MNLREILLEVALEARTRWTGLCGWLGHHPWLGGHPWLTRHRVVVLSTINSLSILVISSIVAALLLQTPEAEAVSDKARTRGTGNGEAGRPAAAVIRAPPAPAARRRPPQAPAKRSPAIGQREYEVQVRRRTRAPGASTAEGLPPPVEAPIQPSEEKIIERSEELAPDDPRAPRG